MAFYRNIQECSRRQEDWRRRSRDQVLQSALLRLRMVPEAQQQQPPARHDTGRLPSWSSSLRCLRVAEPIGITSVSPLGTTRGDWIVKMTSTGKSMSSDLFALQIN